ncbi:MAG: polyprenol monophosphomannose synthase [Candidatus Omnitrophota bacterium]
MRVLIILPTFNEAQNLKGVVEKIVNLRLEADILIIDDNSIDGTREMASGLIEKYKEKVFLIERPAKLGLGSAYIEGFRFALGDNYEYVFEMDADFSHNPEEIPVFLEAVQSADVVIGSRYLDGIRIMNWPLSRLILSYAANVYARLMSGLELTDLTSGYKCFSREALEALPISLIKSNGYAFQIEVNFWCRKLGLRLKEIPITFTDRRAGSSKMSGEIVREAFFLGLKLLCKRCQTTK